MFHLAYLWSKLMLKARGRAVRNSQVHRHAKVEAGSTVVGSEIQRHTFCGYDCTIVNASIGPFCSISSHVSIGGVAHPMHFVSTSPVFLAHRDSVRTKLARHHFLPQLRTTIGADVWIGEAARVKAGLRIGHGAVVGMGAVVTRDVPDYAVVAGNPARVIRYRFDPELIALLLRSTWWDRSDDDLRAVGHLAPDPAAFARQLDQS